MREQRKNKGKRILSWLLALGLLFASLATPGMEVYADNLIIALSANSVKIGDSLKVTIRMPAGVTGTVNLTYSQDIFQYDSATETATTNAGTVSMTLGSYGTGNTRASGTVTFKAVGAGTGSFAVSAPNATNQEGDRVSAGGASTTVTVENSANAGDTNKSSDNSLASLSLSQGTLSPDFSSDVTSYTAEVENDVTSVSVSAKPANDAASVESVTGEEDLAVGENKIEVNVRAENGVTQTYTILLTRKEAVASEPAADTEEAVADTQSADTQEETQVADSSLAVNALNAQVKDLQSQNRMLLWAFIIVVLILLLVIVVLIVRRRNSQELSEEYEEEPQERYDWHKRDHENENEEEPIVTDEFVDDPEETLEEVPEEEPEEELADAIIAQAIADTPEPEVDVEVEVEAEPEPESDAEPVIPDSYAEPEAVSQTGDDEEGDLEFLDI